MGAVFGWLGEGDPAWLPAMAARLAHRGRGGARWSTPSPEVALGEIADGEAGPELGARGLRIVADVDLDDAGRAREALAAGGERFAGDGDAEVLLRGWAARGPAILAELRGDFACAAWDEGRRALVLARDALGARPLYVWRGPRLVVFASEYKAILAVPEVPAEADRVALQVLQDTKFAPPDRTCLLGIRPVPPGHAVEWSAGSERATRFWQVPGWPAPAGGGGHAEELRERFLAAVGRRVGSRAAIGVELSGGVDSAAIAAAVRRVRPDVAIHAFTCGAAWDDREIVRARSVAEAVGAAHHAFVLEPPALRPLLEPIVWHLEDPIARTETALIWETARRAAEHVEVALAGHVADGLYAGMDKHKIVGAIDLVPVLRRPLEEFYHYTQSSAPPLSAPGRLLYAAYYRGGARPSPRVAGAGERPRPAPLPPGPGVLEHVLRGGFPDSVARWIPKAERLHAAHGVRFRSPFMDLDVVEHALRIPAALKLRRFRGKHVLREALRPLLPPAARNVPKFAQAMRYDVELSRVLEETAAEMLAPAAVRARGLFDAVEIDGLRARPAGRPYGADHAMRLWTAILTELWARAFLDRRGAPEDPAPPAEEARSP